MNDRSENSPSLRLVNAYDDLVRMTARNLIKKDPAMCSCEKCYLDVCAIVLNNGFSHYVTTEKGELLAVLPDLGEHKEVELMVATLKAIELVKQRPDHG